MRLAALVLLGLVGAGCLSAYPSFRGEVVNQADQAIEVLVEIDRPRQPLFTAESIVEADSTWSVGTFGRAEGDYTIRLFVDGRLVAEKTQAFGHDTGPGGFGAWYDGEAGGINFWHY